MMFMYSKISANAPHIECLGDHGGDHSKCASQFLARQCLPFLRLIILYALPLEILCLLWKSFAIIFLTIPDHSHSFPCLSLSKFQFLLLFFPNSNSSIIHPPLLFSLLPVFTLSQSSSGTWHLFSEEKTPALSSALFPALVSGDCPLA